MIQHAKSLQPALSASYSPLCLPVTARFICQLRRCKPLKLSVVSLQTSSYAREIDLKETASTEDVTMYPIETRTLEPYMYIWTLQIL
jgi:hypothetical protein